MRFNLELEKFNRKKEKLKKSVNRIKFDGKNDEVREIKVSLGLGFYKVEVVSVRGRFVN